MSMNSNHGRSAGGNSGQMPRNGAPPVMATAPLRTVGKGLKNRTQGNSTILQEQLYAEENTEVYVQKYVNQSFHENPESEPGPVRRASYYSTECDDQPRYKHLVASDVRRQVRQAPENLHAQGKCPEIYENREPLPLQTETPWALHPIVPSPRKGSPPRNYRRPNMPGPVRAVYNLTNRETFDVIYHDEKQQREKSLNSREQNRQALFSMARYHPSQ